MILSVLHLFPLVLLLTTCGGFEGESACENTCPTPNEVTFARRCHCDFLCAALYNDCCFDSPYKVGDPREDIPKWECLLVAGEGRHFFVIGRCRDGWDGDPEVIERCERSSSVIEDPEGQVPVTSRATNVTYKNYYCAVCNDDVGDAVSWKIRARCQGDDVTLDDVQENLEFDRERRQWGVYKRGPLTERRVFRECSILYQRPEEISKESARECVPGLISSCPPSWRDLRIKRKCLSYVNPVFWSEEESYRNIYCAICNQKTTDDYWCELDSSARPKSKSLDAVFRTQSSPCADNESYDSQGKCRPKICIRKGTPTRDEDC